jgi:hypothetical protein
MKRLLVSCRSSLVGIIIYKYTKHCKYLEAYLHQTQTYLQASKLVKHMRTCLHQHKSYLKWLVQ